MSKIIIIFVVLGLVIPPAQSASQELQVDERFGFQLQFPKGWSLLSEDLHSSMLQRQLFAGPNEKTGVFIEKIFTLSEVKKQQWAKGVSEYPLTYADTVITVEEKDWLFEPPIFKSNLFSDYSNGISVFFTEASTWMGYVVFISRDGTFTKLNISTSKDRVDIELASLQAILSTLTFASEMPVIDEDPYTLAERMYRVEQDYDQALFLFKHVPDNHPRFVDALRMIGYVLLGSQFEDWEAALPYVEEAYRLSPEDPNVLEDLGRVYLKTDRVEEGVALLEKAGTQVAQDALNQLGAN